MTKWKARFIKARGPVEHVHMQGTNKDTDTDTDTDKRYTTPRHYAYTREHILTRTAFLTDVCTHASMLHRKTRLLVAMH